MIRDRMLDACRQHYTCTKFHFLHFFPPIYLPHIPDIWNTIITAFKDLIETVLNIHKTIPKEHKSA